MAEFYIQFSCILDVGTADNAKHAELVRAEFGAEVYREEGGPPGFAMMVQPELGPGALWLHSDDQGDPEHVIQFVLRLAEELSLAGVWGFSWSYTCSKPRIDAFGGGAHVLDLGPRRSITTTRPVGAWIEARFGVIYASRSGLIQLLYRLGFVHHRPEAVSSKMDPEKQRRFIAGYEALLNGLLDDEMVMFGEAVHPVNGAKPVGYWAPADVAVAVEQATGREHVNIQGAIDLETGMTEMLKVDRVDAASTIALLKAIEARFPKRRKIHVFLDNARCHHAWLVREWLSQPGRRIRLHFFSPYCPHLNPIERL